MKVTSIRLDDDRLDELQAAAIRRGVTVSEVVRDALDAYMGDDIGKSADLAKARKYLNRRARASGT